MCNCFFSRPRLHFKPQSRFQLSPHECNFRPRSRTETAFPTETPHPLVIQHQRSWMHPATTFAVDLSGAARLFGVSDDLTPAQRCQLHDSVSLRVNYTQPPPPQLPAGAAQTLLACAAAALGYECETSLAAEHLIKCSTMQVMKLRHLFRSASLSSHA